MERVEAEIKTRIACNSNLNSPFEERYLLMCTCMDDKYLPLTKKLLMHGANPNVSNDRYTALDSACSDEFECQEPFPLPHNYHRRGAQTVKELLTWEESNKNCLAYNTLPIKLKYYEKRPHFLLSEAAAFMSDPNKVEDKIAIIKLLVSKKCFSVDLDLNDHLTKWPLSSIHDIPVFFNLTSPLFYLNYRRTNEERSTLITKYKQSISLLINAGINRTRHNPPAKTSKGILEVLQLQLQSKEFPQLIELDNYIEDGFVKKISKILYKKDPFIKLPQEIVILISKELLKPWRKVTPKQLEKFDPMLN